MKGYIIICKNCGDEVKDVRTDRIYCSTKCKNHYHNKDNNKLYSETKRTHKILRTNLQVQKYYYNLGKDIVTTSELRDLGYRFEYFTHKLFIGESRKPILFTYQYGIQSIGENKYKIIYKEDGI